MVWRIFRKRSVRPARDDAWWDEAERMADAPDISVIAGLRASILADTALDELEQQEEMVDGLEQLAALASRDEVPVIATQHRVIGTDTCHVALPATLSGEQDVPGKVFLTSRRIVFAGGRAQSWPWHRVRAVDRNGRVVRVVVAGPSDALHLHCNSYGDAAVVTHVSRHLTSRRNRTPGSDA